MGNLGEITPTTLVVSWMLCQSPRQMKTSVSIQSGLRRRNSSFATFDPYSLDKRVSYNTYDGQNIRNPDPLIKANDTIKLDLESNKITDFIKFEFSNVVMVTEGRNRGHVGNIKNRKKHKGSFENQLHQDATSHTIATRLGNVFTTGRGTKPFMSHPKGKGIKLSITEEARKKARQQPKLWLKVVAILCAALVFIFK